MQINAQEVGFRPSTWRAVWVAFGRACFVAAIALGALCVFTGDGIVGVCAAGSLGFAAAFASAAWHGLFPQQREHVSVVRAHLMAESLRLAAEQRRRRKDLADLRALDRAVQPTLSERWLARWHAYEQAAEQQWVTLRSGLRKVTTVLARAYAWARAVFFFFWGRPRPPLLSP